MKEKGDGQKCCSSDKKSIFSTCDCTVDSDVGTGDFLLIQGILHLYGHTHVRSHVSPDMDCLICVYLVDFSHFLGPFSIFIVRFVL